MSPPTLDKFLAEIAQIVKDGDGSKLQDFLVIEPPFSPLYGQLIAELRQAYPTASSHDALEKKCTSFVPEYDDSENGGSRASFLTFLVKYFAFIRDVNVENLVETHDILKALVK